jgi:hypothetical protein
VAGQWFSSGTLFWCQFSFYLKNEEDIDFFFHNHQILEIFCLYDSLIVQCLKELLPFFIKQFFFIPVTPPVIASNDNNQCMQFVCPYCGPIDWNNKYSYSYTYSLLNGMIQ